MDLKTRLRQLQEAHAAGYVNNIEFQELRTDLLNALRSFFADSDEYLDPTTATDLPAENSRACLSEREHTSSDEEEAELAPVATYLEMLAPGLEIGPHNHRFRLERMLGESKASQVWLAYDLSAREAGFDQYKALKIFAPRREDYHPSQQGNEPTASTEQFNLRRFLVRVRARATLGAAINHTNIVRVYGWRLGSDGWPFVEMEHLAGRNLRQVLIEEGKPGLSVERTLNLLKPVAVALDYVHQYHRVPHRHLKLENVLITDQGLIKLLDYGIASLSRDHSNTVRNSEPNSGLPRFLAAELQTANQIRLKQDVHDLGALVYELLSGNSPCPGDNGVQSPQLTPKPQKPPHLTEHAWQVLSQNLERENAAVPSSAGELLHQLEKAQGTVHGLRSPSAMRSITILALLGFSVASLYWWYGPQLRTATVATPPTVQQHIAKSAQAVTAISPETATMRPLLAEVAETNSSVRLMETADSLESQLETDNRAFAAAQRIGTISAYEIYLQRCPDCAHREIAEATISQLRRQTEIDILKTYFDQALSHETLEADDQAPLTILEEVAIIDAKNPFLAEGRHRFALICLDMAKKKSAAGQFAQARHWLAKGKALQQEFPALDYFAEQLNQAETKYKDDSAFARAQQEHVRTAYQAYLDNCIPHCGHARAAHAAMEQLKSEPPSNSNRIFRDQLTAGGQGPELILLPTGTFWMGSAWDEKGRLQDESQRQIQITSPFAIGRYEITFAEYDRFVSATGHRKPSDEDWGRGKQPVINVSWQDAIAYTEWLSAQTGENYRLPTEAEWEYAARAGTTTSRYWGNHAQQGCAYANGADLVGQSSFPGWTDVMNCSDGYLHTAPVGSYKANGFDLFDMLGNALEWTCSNYEQPYHEAMLRCAKKGTTDHVVARGGSWSDQPRGIRAADRHKALPGYQDYFLGFRVARDL